MNSKKLLFVNFLVTTLLVLSAEVSSAGNTELVEACGIGSTNTAARTAALRNADCPEGYVKDQDPDFLCSTLDESLDREIDGQTCDLRRGSVLILCTVRCFKDGFVENAIRAIFPPNSPNDIGNGRRSRPQGCVNVGGVLSCN